MVKIWLSTVTLVCLFALLLLGTISWLLYTPNGSRWLLTQMSDWSPVELSIGRIEGTLGGKLQLSEVSLQDQGMQLNLEQFSAHNRLTGLLPLSLDIELLHIDGLQIKTLSVPQKQPKDPFQWPKPHWLLDLLQVNFKNIELKNLSWQQDKQQPQQIELFSGEALWKNGRLEGNKLLLKMVELQGNGSFSIDLQQTSLKLAGQIDSRDTTTAWRQLQLQADLQPGSAEEVLSGPVSLNITGNQRKLLEATAELGLTAERLLFRQLQLRRPQRPGTITATGSLQFSGDTPELVSQLQFSKLDLLAETGQPLQLSGSLQINGDLENYRGRFDLINQGKGLFKARLAGDFKGDLKQISLHVLQGDWLSGRFSGQLQAGWGNGWQLQTHLTGNGIDPQQLHPRLSGQLNLQLQADLATNDSGTRNGRLQLQLHESHLNGQPLTGEALLQVENDALQIEQLQLRGKGIVLQANGNLAERLDAHWQIDQLEQLLPDLSGQLSGDGWMRWHPEGLATEFSATGEKLAFRQWQLGKLQLNGTKNSSKGGWQLQLDGQKLLAPQRENPLDQLSINLQGEIAKHRIMLDLIHQKSQISASFNGSWEQQQWQGELTRLRGEDENLGHWQSLQATPLLVSADLIRIDPLLLRGGQGGQLQLQGNYLPEVQQASAALDWQALDLAQLRPWLGEWQLSGQSSGRIQLQHREQSSLYGKVNFTGALQHQKLQLQFSPSSLQINWDQHGLQSSLQLQLADGGQLQGVLNSTEAMATTWPKQGELQLTGRDFPLKMLHPWLPPELNISGSLEWSADGRWQAGKAMQIAGKAQTGEGQLSWQEEYGIVNADINSAELSWQWQDQLDGQLLLQLSELGRVESNFNLPLAARLPLSLAPDAALSADLHARLQEHGLLSVLFPGRIQESRGQLALDLRLRGNRHQPIFHGDFTLSEAGVFLPPSGTQLKDIKLQGNFTDNRVEITNLQLSSDGGQLHGSGRMELKNWLPGAYQLQLKGENFQLINLPEMQVRTNPELFVDGVGKNLKVRGKLIFPEVLISSKQKTALASNSPDLLVVDRETPPLRQKKLQHDIDLQLILGERVLLNTAGIDARLEGNLRLLSSDKQELAANGEIHVVKGKYSSYGVSLDISRGNLYFTGGPLDQPALDILALRKAGEVQAGVKVTGTPQQPVVQLYSEPVMAETDILSYIVLGRPVGGDSGQTGMLLTAAGALLSQGESVSLQEKLKNRLGLDSIDVSTGNGDVQSSIITTGKYLSPDLYISLGYSLFSNSNEMTVRYNLTPAWEIESSIGTDSGIDMFYRIEIK